MLRWEPASSSSVLAQMRAGCAQPRMQPGRAVWKPSDAAWLQTSHMHLSRLSTSPPPPPPSPKPLFTFRSGCLHYFHLLPLLWQHPLRTEGHWDFKGEKQFYAAGEVHLFLAFQCWWGRGVEGRGQLNLLFGPLFPPHYDVNSQINWSDPSLRGPMSDEVMIKSTYATSTR